MKTCDSILKCTTKYGSKELILITFTNRIYDIGHEIDIQFDSCVIISFSGNVNALKLFIKKHKTTLYTIPDSLDELNRILDKLDSPPPMRSTMEMIKICFPKKSLDLDSISFCACHGKLNRSYFTCSFCSSNVCKIPSDCPVCETVLITPTFLMQASIKSMYK